VRAAQTSFEGYLGRFDRASYSITYSVDYEMVSKRPSCEVERSDPVTFRKICTVRLAGWSVCKHHVLSTRANWQRLGVELIDLVFNVEVNFGCGAVLGYLLTVEFHF
jgi:hypothetical protein